jgi:alpha-tubulin suppressor-like RCC1 family protein
MTRSSTIWVAALAAAAISCRKSPAPETSASQTVTAVAAPSAAASSLAAPVPVSAGPRRIAAGEAHSCFVDRSHDLWCWGNNGQGELGDGSYGFRGRAEDAARDVNERATPARVPSLDGRVAEVAAGSGNTCAITVDRELFCWGVDDGDPRLESYRPLPKPRALGGPVLSVSMKGTHSCAVSADHGLWCWGLNEHGQLGTGKVDPNLGGPYPRPAQRVAALGNAVEKACVGDGTSCALDRSGTVSCWGSNSSGLLDAKDPSDRPLPLKIALPERAVDLACGATHACAALASGQVACWGRNYEGQLGDGRPRRNEPYGSPVPALVVGLAERPAALALGSPFSLVLGASGAVWAFGKSPVPGDARAILAPARVAPLEAAIQIAAGLTHACAVTAAEAVYCWGQGQAHQLGDGQAEHRPDPVLVAFPRP